MKKSLRSFYLTVYVELKELLLFSLPLLIFNTNQNSPLKSTLEQSTWVA